MLPSKSDERWKKLLTGEINHDFKCVPAGLMISRLRREAQKRPSDISELIGEVHRFFEKYESIMKDDVAALFRKGEVHAGIR